MNRDIVWFKEVSKSDIGLVGGKGANLGEMQRAKAPVPNGYIVTAQAYFDFFRIIWSQKTNQSDSRRG